MLPASFSAQSAEGYHYSCCCCCCGPGAHSVSAPLCPGPFSISVCCWIRTNAVFDDAIHLLVYNLLTRRVASAMRFVSTPQQQVSDPTASHPVSLMRAISPVQRRRLYLTSNEIFRFATNKALRPLCQLGAMPMADGSEITHHLPASPISTCIGL